MKALSNEDVEILRRVVNIARLHVGEAFKLAPGDEKVIREWLHSFRRAFGVRWEDRCVDNLCHRVWIWRPLGLGGWEMARSPIPPVQGPVSYAGIREGGRVKDSLAFLLLLAVAIPAIVGAIWAEGVGWALKGVEDPQKAVRGRWHTRLDKHREP